MPPREWRARVQDVLEAAERALAYVQGLDPERFAADPRTVDAVSYTVVVIGEAVKAIPENVTLAAPEIPWADIRGMRNKVAHEYFGVDSKVLWQTVQEDLPPLTAALRALLARADLD
ncbi:MAG TPA: DUF86 domain-containing protein [Vicinamibacteria bacterium]